jgi:hypothetical protein
MDRGVTFTAPQSPLLPLDPVSQQIAKHFPKDARHCRAFGERGRIEVNEYFSQGGDCGKESRHFRR